MQIPRNIWVLPFLAAVAVFSGLVWWLSLRTELNQLSVRARTDLALASDRLAGQLFRHRDLPVVMAAHPDLVSLLNGSAGPGGTTRASLLLRGLADKTGLYSFELIDHSGFVAAASDPTRFGLAAPAGAPLDRALQGALGTSSRVAKYATGRNRRLFSFAAPVFDGAGPPIGALLAEVDIFEFEENWPTTRSAVFFTTVSGRVFVANRSELILTDRWSEEEFPIYRKSDLAGHELWGLDGGKYLPARALHLEQPLPVIGMTGEILIDTGPARQTAILQAAFAAALCLVFGAVLFVLLERRRLLTERLALEAAANARLEGQVARRTAALSEANAELRRTQAELVQAGKLSALGQMSAGISHELNQPLMAISSFAENGRLLVERGRSDDAGEVFSRISEVARRMGRIIKNLRAFARNESEPVADVDIVAATDNALEMLAARIASAGVEMHWPRPENPVLVRGGEVRLSQVVMNLVSNALDAMEGTEEKCIEIGLETAGKTARLTVRDTGPGIAEPDRIFDPFYTTKAVGAAEGLGLGLSISYGLVQSFGGAIRGQNHPQGGAVFTVELELAEQNEEART